jgi:hypothetical protein
MPYEQTTLERLRDLLRGRTDTTVFWTDEEARLALNEVLRDWNLLTGRWRARVTVPVAPQNPRVTLPAALTLGLRVTLPTGAAVDPTSLTELELMEAQWRVQSTADGGRVPSRVTLWAPESLTTIVIWPFLQSGGTLRVDGIAATPVLVDEADWIDLGREHLAVVVDMALHVLTFKEGGVRFRATRPAWVAFLQAAVQENQRLKGQQAFRRILGWNRRRDLERLKGDEIRGSELPDQVAGGDR